MYICNIGSLTVIPLGNYLLLKNYPVYIKMIRVTREIPFK